MASTLLTIMATTMLQWLIVFIRSSTMARAHAIDCSSSTRTATPTNYSGDMPYSSTPFVFGNPDHRPHNETRTAATAQTFAHA